MQLNKSEIAAALGVSTTRIEKYSDREFPIPRVKDGRRYLYPLKEVIEWYVSFKNTSSYVDNNLLNPQQEKAKKDRADRLLKEHDLKMKQSAFIPFDDALNQFEQAAGAVKTTLLAAPNRYSIEFSEPKTAQRVLKTVVTKILDDLSKTEIK